MKNTTLTLLLVLIVYTGLRGQNNNDETKDKMKGLSVEIASLKSDLKQKEETISQQSNEINELNKELKYYKKTLEIVDSKVDFKDKGVTFKINSVLGNSSNGKITIEGIMENNSDVRSIQTREGRCYDPQGNILCTYKMNFGEKINRIERLIKDVPIKFFVEIENFSPECPVIKALVLDYYSNVGYKRDDLEFCFKNLQVQWN